MTFDHQLPPLIGVLGLAIAYVIYLIMVKQDEGGEKIKKIADAKELQLNNNVQQ